MIGNVWLVAVITYSLILNYVRHTFSALWNKVAFVVSAFIVTMASSWFLDQKVLPWLLVFCIILSAYSFFLVGGVIAGLLSMVAVYFSRQNDPVYVIRFGLISILFGVVGGFCFAWLHKRKERQQQWIGRLLKQSKDLHILREISVSLQSTLELDRLIHIILTSITAGYGLGFNRALLFTASDDRHNVRGMFGIGPMTVTEGYDIWKNVVTHNMTLTDFIALKDKARHENHQLNALLQSMTFSLTDPTSVFYQALLQKRPIIVRHVDLHDTTQKQLHDAFQMDECAVIPLLNRTKPVGILVIDNVVNRNPITDESLESIMPIISQAALAIENARMFNHTEWMAQTDDLTGLYNHRYFQKTLHQEIVRAKVSLQALSLIIVDIDYFKVYNDTNGHDRGNEALQNVALIMKSVIGAQGLVCRFGGEEFVVLISGKSKTESKIYADQIRVAVETTNFYHEDTQPLGKLTVSVGIASFPDDGDQPDQIFQSADRALYQAKSLGRNCIVVS